MTREEAINELNYIKESFAKCELSYEALDMAIKALEPKEIGYEDCAEALTIMYKLNENLKKDGD